VHINYQPLYRDGTGDDGERLREVATRFVEQGWDAGQIMERVKAQPWIPLGWSEDRILREVERCGAKFGPKPTAKPQQQIAHDDGIPGWLRERIESTAIPADRDLYFREVVAALAVLDWDVSRITIKIVGRPWVPERYAANASRHLEEWGVKPVAMAALAARADLRASLRSKAARATQGNATQHNKATPQRTLRSPSKRMLRTSRRPSSATYSAPSPPADGGKTPSRRHGPVMPLRQP
jgi:hypothetical protein